MRDAGHRTPDIGQRTAKKAKIIYPPPRGVDIINSNRTLTVLNLHPKVQQDFKGQGHYDKVKGQIKVTP